MQTTLLEIVTPFFWNPFLAVFCGCRGALCEPPVLLSKYLSKQITYSREDAGVGSKQEEFRFQGMRVGFTVIPNQVLNIHFIFFAI